MGNPVTLDFSTAQPITPAQPGQSQASPVTLDFSTAQPIDAPAAPSLWDKVKGFFTDDGGTPGGQVTVKEDYTGGSHQIIVPAPGEDFADTMKRAVEMGKTVTPDQINSEVQNTKGVFKNIATGAAKSVGQTALQAQKLGLNVATSGAYSSVEPQAMKDLSASLEPTNPDQKAGQNLETVLEFFAGDEALKGLSMADRFAQFSKVSKFMEAYPRLANILSDAIRTGTVAATVGGVHDGTEGAIQGATAGVLLGGGASALSEVPGVISDAIAGAKKLPGIISDAVSDGLSRAKPLVSKDAAAATIQPGLQDSIRSVANDTATAQGVTPDAAVSIRDALSNTADAVKAKAKDLFGQIDTATGGKFQTIDNALRENQNMLRGATSDKEVATLTKQRAKLEAQQDDIFKTAQAQGVEKSTVDVARNTYKQASALTDLNTKIEQSTRGLRPDVATGNATPETVNPQLLLNRLNSMYDSGRLQQALGDAGAKRLLNEVDAAVRNKATAINRAALVKNVAKYAAKVTGAGVVGGGVIKHFLLP